MNTPSSSIAQHLLGTANYLTATLCLVTQQQPQNVCQLRVIQSLEAVLG